MDQLEFRLLGPFEVRNGRRMILSGGGKRRAILAVLLLSANEAVSVERLIDALWGETPLRRRSTWCRATCRTCGASWSQTGRGAQVASALSLPTAIGWWSARTSAT